MEILSHGHKGVVQEDKATSAVADVRASLAQFPLGRFLMENLGLNGHWTSYVLMHPDRGRISNVNSEGQPFTELEGWLLNRCPIFLATQERFRIFRDLTQPLVRPGMKMASLPAGLMDDLLTLDYSESAGVELTGVDLDPETLHEAEENFKRVLPAVKATFEKCDAWELGSAERWDLITSNGLNIYVQEDDRCTDFYRNVARALKPEGVFILSFIAPPEQWQPTRQSDLDYQRFLFKEVVPVKWSCVRDEEKTRQQLAAAGFDVLEVRYDQQRMFPAVLAKKVS
jgi:ubiquinone/menaquinone biosynthesis C-methylase UbiE